MIELQINEATLPFSAEKMSKWFTGIVGRLEADHFMLKENVASEDTTQHYAPFINEDEDQIYTSSKMASSIYFIKKMLNDYINELQNRNVKLNQLALDLSRSKILVWAEVADDDENAINQLILAEAKTNSNCYNTGFDIATTVVEASDMIAVPPHYNPIQLFHG